MTSIASVGECMLELSGAGADWRMGHAGDTFNTLWALRALLPGDWSADYVSAFGDDPFSAVQVAFFEAHGIGTADSPRIAGARPGLYAITLDGAERSFTYWRADAAARRLADDPAALARSLKGRRLVYLSGITLAILGEAARASLRSALEAARSAGSTIAFDPNYRPRLWPDIDASRSALSEFLPLVDIALPTFSDEQALFGDGTPAVTAERLAALGVGEIAVKNGDGACLVVAGDIRGEIAARSVKPVDTTGAGDSFNGGYLAARLLGHDSLDAACRAHAVAAATIQVRGALAPMDALRTAFATVG